MDSDRLAELSLPQTDREAEEWLGAVVGALGARFDPDEGFSGYWLDDDEEQRLNADLVQVRRLLGVRVRDLTYRAADAWLSQLDVSYRRWARPVTQPPPRLWLVERPYEAEDDDPPFPARGLAFEDGRGSWWIWEPATGRFHNDEPWLFADFYYTAGAHRGVFVESDFKQRMRFTPLSAAEARRLIDTREIDGGNREFVANREDDDISPPDVDRVLSQAADPVGWEPSADPDTLIKRPRRIPKPPGPLLTPLTGKVQLFYVEVEVERLLAGPGTALVEVLAPHEPFERVPDLDELPTTGWRQVGEWPARSGRGERVLIAAPHQDDPDGWALIDICNRDGQRILSVITGPVRPRPGKEVRRKGLRLSWPQEPILAAAGKPLELKVELTNVGESEWHDREPGSGEWPDHDVLHVLAWLFDQDGKQLPTATHFSHAGFNQAITIAPGLAVTVPVHVMTKNVEHLPPGDYEIRAMLSSLDLRAEPAAIRLVDMNAGGGT